MDIISLQKLLKTHQNLPFPTINNNEELADWITDLAEADGYYVGLAVSLIAGKSIKRIPSSTHLQQMRKRLEKLKESEHIDGKLFKQCLNYLLSLEKLAKALA